jgi:hypothetical protein
MKTKLVLSIITLALIPFYAGAAETKKPEHEANSFNWKFAFTESQISALAKSGYSWGEELIPNGDMQSSVAGFHDIYNLKKGPPKIVINKETGERELVLMRRKDERAGLAGDWLRVFFKTNLKAGDIILAQYRFLSNSRKDLAVGGGCWDPEIKISTGLLKFHETFKYSTGFSLFLVKGNDSRFSNRLNLDVNMKNFTRELRITHWSARKLITKDSDGDGKSDAEEILMTKTSPSQPNDFINKLTEDKPKAE